MGGGGYDFGTSGGPAYYVYCITPSKRIISIFFLNTRPSKAKKELLFLEHILLRN